MLPEPLHPAIVHFPIVLTFLLPVFALASLWAVRRGARPLLAWGPTAALAVALAASAWIAVETGEDQEERVEEVLASEAALETHEEAAERFLTFAAALLVVTAIGLAPGRVGRTARAATVVGALALVVAGWSVGRSGGELVYRHGAADAYVRAAATLAASDAEGGDDAVRRDARVRHEEEDDDD